MMSTNTRFSDIVLEDAKLSMSAKGVFVSIGFLGNGCKLEKLLNRTTDSTAAVLKALEELLKAGYIEMDANKTIHVKSPAVFGSKL